MPVLDRILSRAMAAPAAKADSAPRPPAWALRAASAERDAIPEGESVEAQLKAYEQLSWIQIAVSAVAQSAAFLALNVEEWANEETKAIKNHPFEQLLRRPNPKQSRFEFLEAHYSYYAMGNSYWFLNRSNEHAPPSEIWIIPSYRIAPVPDGNMFLRGYLYDTGDGGAPMPLETWEVAHFKRFHPRSMYVGLNPITALWIDAHGDLAAQRWNANFFAKDNAKTAGIVAYAEMVGDPDWKRIKAEWEGQSGGTKNKRMVLMRGAGKGGVEWIPTAMSQADMQFLELRHFTKEECYDLIAPGLAAALSPNANTASGRTGDAVLTARAVYPLVVATAEKATNNILPAYGDNLVCVAEDPRLKDRAIELQEQAAYERTHTIKEVRKKYYSDEPLGDARDKLLPSEVGKGLTDGRDPEALEQAAQAAAPPPLDDGNAALPPAGEGGESVLLPGSLDDALALDMAKWQRKALKRLDERGSAACAFTSDVIPDDEHAVIAHALLHAGNAETVRACFKRAPGEDLTDVERPLYERLRQTLERHGTRLTSAILAGEQPDAAPLSADIRAALLPSLAEAVNDHLADMALSIGVSFDAPSAGADIATAYVSRYMAGIDQTTRQGIERAVSAYRSTPGMRREDLLTLLRGTVGARRAELVAVTSLTEASNQATAAYQQMLAEQGIQMERVWQTANDDRTCPICGPLHGKPESEWKDRFPHGGPAHPRCRCGTTLRSVKR